MPPGGRQPGAGRPPGSRVREPAVRTVSAQLSQAEDAALTALELHWGVLGAEAVRRAVLDVAMRLAEATPEPAKRSRRKAVVA
jgi:hypothetical protein